MEMLVVLLALTELKWILTEADKNSAAPIHPGSREVPIFISRHLNTPANLPQRFASWGLIWHIRTSDKTDVARSEQLLKGETELLRPMTSSELLIAARK